jgi:hypothetical protein
VVPINHIGWPVESIAVYFPDSSQRVQMVTPDDAEVAENLRVRRPRMALEGRWTEARQPMGDEPKWRMRTNRRGNEFIKNRLRNSYAVWRMPKYLPIFNINGPKSRAQRLLFPSGRRFAGNFGAVVCWAMASLLSQAGLPVRYEGYGSGGRAVGESGRQESMDCGRLI